MSTVKADTLQPTISGNNLILKTGSGDVERLRITPTGTMTVASGVGTVFAGGVSFSAPMNVNGKMGIGAAYGGTPVVDLDIVSAANASVLDPQFNTFNTTQTRAVAAFRTSASNTTLFFGHGGISAAWIQAQSSDPGTAQRSILLNPVGGNVGIGTTGPVVALDVVGQARCSSGTTYSDSSSTLTTKSYVDDMQRIGATRHLAVFTNTSSVISSIIGYNTTAAFTITSAGGSLNVLIPSGFGTWHILVGVYNTSSGALNALGVATVTSGVNTSIATLTNSSPGGQSIMLSCTRHS